MRCNKWHREKRLKLRLVTFGTGIAGTVSSVNNWFGVIALKSISLQRWPFNDLTLASHKQLKWGPFGGSNSKTIFSFEATSLISDICFAVPTKLVPLSQYNVETPPFLAMNRCKSDKKMSEDKSLTNSKCKALVTKQIKKQIYAFVYLAPRSRLANFPKESEHYG